MGWSLRLVLPRNNNTPSGQGSTGGEAGNRALRHLVYVQERPATAGITGVPAHPSSILPVLDTRCAGTGAHTATEQRSAHGDPEVPMSHVPAGVQPAWSRGATFWSSWSAPCWLNAVGPMGVIAHRRTHGIPWPRWLWCYHAFETTLFCPTVSCSPAAYGTGVGLEPTLAASVALVLPIRFRHECGGCVLPHLPSVLARPRRRLPRSGTLYSLRLGRCPWKALAHADRRRHGESSGRAAPPAVRCCPAEAVHRQ